MRGSLFPLLPATKKVIFERGGSSCILSCKLCIVLIDRTRCKRNVYVLMWTLHPQKHYENLIKSPWWSFKKRQTNPHENIIKTIKSQKSQRCSVHDIAPRLFSTSVIFPFCRASTINMQISTVLNNIDCTRTNIFLLPTMYQQCNPSMYHYPLLFSFKLGNENIN